MIPKIIHNVWLGGGRRLLVLNVALQVGKRLCLITKSRNGMKVTSI